MDGKQVYDMFAQINADCMTNEPEAYRPLNADNLEYYISQMENLEYSQAEIHSFCNYLLELEFA